MKPLALALILAAAPLCAEPYAAACAGTIVPPWLLRAVAVVESGERDDAIGDDGVSIGRYQLNETYHAERAAKWGEYDPADPIGAGRIAARVLEDCYRALCDWMLAICAYRQGVRGVRVNGPALWYWERVRREIR